jgi:hypothetical protein
MRLAAPKRILRLITPSLRGLSGVETRDQWDDFLFASP